MLVGQREKSRKYFDLSTFNYNLTDSNPCKESWCYEFSKVGTFFWLTRYKQVNEFDRLWNKKYVVCSM